MSKTPDLAAVFDEHLRNEFELHDAAATMTTMSGSPHLYHLPTMAGGNGRDEIFTFYRDHFVTKWPKDTTATQISRTIGEDDTAMDALLPGVAPTGKPVALPIVVVVKFHDGKVAQEHIYWDQASLLVQVGLLDRSDLPVTGAEQAQNLLDGSYATNKLLAGL
jgi:carboxymethylenebutenolidase